jgi:hypothetical protein
VPRQLRQRKKPPHLLKHQLRQRKKPQRLPKRQPRLRKKPPHLLKHQPHPLKPQPPSRHLHQLSKRPQKQLHQPLPKLHLRRKAKANSSAIAA